MFIFYFWMVIVGTQIDEVKETQLFFFPEKDG